MLFADDKILYLDNSKECTHTNILEPKNKISKVAKPIAFLYSSNEESKNEIKQTIPFIIVSNKIYTKEYMLPRRWKACTLKNTKYLKKEIKDINKCKYILISWIGRQYCYDDNIS